MPAPYFYSPLFLLLAASHGVAAALNRTIDDEHGDSVTGARPRYDPADQWSQGASCTGCNIRPDPSRAFQGTWHDTTQLPGVSPRSVSLDFTGTAIYAYAIISNTNPNALTRTRLTFLFDNILLGPYEHDPDPTRSDILYNVLVFSRTGLTNSPHTLIIQTDGGSDGSVCMFDYAQYTVDDGNENNPPPPPPHTTSSSSPPQSSSPEGNPGTSSSSPVNPGSSSVPPNSAPTSQPSQTSNLSNPPNSGTNPDSSLSSPSGPLSTSASDASQSSASGPLADTTLGSAASALPPSTVTENTRTTIAVVGSSAQEGSRFPTAAVVGSVLGFILILILLLLLFLWRRRRGRRTTSVPYLTEDSEKAGASGRVLGAGAEGGGAAGGNVSAASRNKESQYRTSGSQTSLLVKDPLQENNDDSARLGLVDYTPSERPMSTSDSVTLAHEHGYGLSMGRVLGAGVVRPLPNVPALSRSQVAAAADVRDSQYTDLSLSSAVALHGLFADEKSNLNARVLSGSESDIRSGSMSRTLPVPATASSPSSVYLQRLQHSRTPSMTTSGASHVTELRSQVVALQEELARVREEQEMQRLLDEAPPAYNDARTERPPYL